MSHVHDIAHHIRQLSSDDEVERRTARAALLLYDEGAVVPLIDEFYAGVNEQAGLAILSVLGEIGGFEALALLEDVLHFSARYESWRVLAANCLQRDGRL